MIEEIYKQRFSSEKTSRNKIYEILCSSYFQQYVPHDSTVLEIAAGYCEFINHISAKNKIAVDINPDAKQYAAANVNFYLSSSTNLHWLKNVSVDVIYVSNFFEHITKEDIVKTLKECHRVLKSSGRIMILQPNIRYCYKEYWMFFDHITPLDDRSLAECLEVNGFKVIKNVPRFLPFTTKSKLPKYPFLIKLYLKIPLFQKIFGKQAFIVARKN